MKTLGLILLAGILTAASVVNIFDEVSVSRDEAKERLVETFGWGYLNLHYDVVKKARSLAEPARVEGVRQLVRFAREYTQTADFKKEYKRWRDQQLGYKQKKKLGIPNPMKMIDKAIDKQLNKAEDDKKLPADPNELIKKRLQEFLTLSASVDFEAEVSGGRFVKSEYEAKSREWKMCYRAGKAVIMAAREEVELWLKELE